MLKYSPVVISFLGGTFREIFEFDVQPSKKSCITYYTEGSLGLAKDDFQFSFPVDHWNGDQINRIRYEGGRQIQHGPQP